MRIDPFESLNHQEIVDASIRLLNGVQGLHPALQMSALVSTMTIAMDVFDIDVRREVERMERLMYDAENNGFNKKFDVVREYITKQMSAKLLTN